MSRREPSIFESQLRFLFGRRKRTILQSLFALDDREILDIIVDRLNSTEHLDSEELRRLVTRWKASGPNLNKMVCADQDLLKDLRNLCRGVWTPSNGARALMVAVPVGPGPPDETPTQTARLMFGTFTYSTFCELLGGPCEICGRWFTQKTRHSTRFCSKKCASLATRPAAIKTTEEKRKDSHQRRINWARDGIVIWASKPRLEGWESWVVRYINNQESAWAKKNQEGEPRPLTKKSLTRWVNKGELRPPSKKKERKRK